MTTKSKRKAERKRLAGCLDGTHSAAAWERGNLAFYLDAAGEFRRKNAHKETAIGRERRAFIHSQRIAWVHGYRLSAQAEGFKLP